jgi:hypothetical protein
MSGPEARVAVSLTLVAALAAAPLVAQGPLRGYAIDVAGASGRNALVAGGFSNFARLRLMSDLRAALGAGTLRLEAAYEHTVRYDARGGSAAGFATGATAHPGDWLPLDWQVAAGRDAAWRHRFDRLNVALAWSRSEVRAGRQAISWATMLLLTPADPFAPFDPSDPFREYRSGVDAVRVQLYPGPFSEVDLVVRPATTPAGTSTSALARGRATLAGWDLSAWAGTLYGQAAGAVGVTRTVGGWGARGAAELRAASAAGGSGGGVALRGALGVDRRVTV